MTRRRSSSGVTRRFHRPRFRRENRANLSFLENLCVHTKSHAQRHMCARSCPEVGWGGVIHHPRSNGAIAVRW
jgi:hypothetical protein